MMKYYLTNNGLYCQTSQITNDDFIEISETEYKQKLAELNQNKNENSSSENEKVIIGLED